MIKIKNGKLFSEQFLILGYIGIIISLIAIVHSNIMIGLFILFFSCLFCFSVIEMEIDYENKKIKEIIRFNKFRYCSYLKIDDYSKVSMRKIKRVEKRNFPRTMLSSTFVKYCYEVCLFSENLRKRKMIKRFDNFADAQFLLNNLSEKLKVKIIN